MTSYRVHRPGLSCVTDTRLVEKFLSKTPLDNFLPSLTKRAAGPHAARGAYPPISRAIPDAATRTKHEAQHLLGGHGMGRRRGHRHNSRVMHCDRNAQASGITSALRLL
ncbi:hypothetical protein G7K_6562-t1 [Saitoella complicata NRRL Y-17804]|uniref:Uncharacterized protein n=1 Tax=Saitoella complicata (strain BCRC 22490 / CBS 7301 / JCM 7358 / NBRC 10748 / NRRL Y-17804) TaxID=698492 RepID=A0A0E9NRJ5_SAICN|nr:hypothetical protein G7K_6562-t1 [Saitoella complicata NRRL Y-17804]